MIYFDNAATTAMYVESAEILANYACNRFYNPSALYRKAAEITEDIKSARKDFASILYCKADDIYFTASGSESDNMAVLGCNLRRGSRVIISAVEHAAVYNAAMSLANKGIEICIAPVDEFGRIDIEKFTELLDDRVGLVSVMHVTNETGAINDIDKLSKLTKSIAPKAIFHSDGVQALGKVEINLLGSDIDMYSFSAHKFHGAKGVGGIYIRKGIHITPIVYGGGQEKGLRSATENVGGIIASAHALKKFVSQYDIEKISRINQLIREGVKNIEPNIVFLTSENNASHHILTFALPNARGEVLLHMLEDKGIIVGTGSACSSHKGNKRIVKALGVNPEYDMGVIRLSFSDMTDMSEADEFIQEFEQVYTTFKQYMRR